MKQQQITVIAILLVIVAFSAVIILSNNIITESPEPKESFYYTYEIVNSYPHDKSAFTQGLVIEDGILYEGTGLYGQSTLRRVDLETGNVTQVHFLFEGFFGEGITVFEIKSSS